MARRIFEDKLTKGGRLVFMIDSYKDTGNYIKDVADTHFFKLVDSWDDNDGIDDYDSTVEYNHYFLIDLVRSSFFIYELNLYEAYKLVSLWAINKTNKYGIIENVSDEDLNGENSNDELLEKISELIGCAEEEYEEDEELRKLEEIEC